MTGTRRALGFSIAERYLTLVVGLASSMILARLLTPELIGIFSVTLAFIGIAQVLRDFGVANYLIQERNLTQDHVRTAFGILLVLGALVFVALFASAPWIAGAYDEEQLVQSLRVCAFNFLVLPFCTVSLALLRRQMVFKRLAAVNIAATCASSAVSVGLAAAGFGLLALALGSVLLNVVTGIGAWLAREDRRLLLPSFKEWRVVLNFGAQSSAAAVVTSVSMDINDLAVGKVMGFEPVAILSRAQGLMNLFHRDLMGAIRNVAYPAYANAARDGAALEPLYLKSVANITAVAWPFYGFVSLFALELLRLMFGPQWDAAAALVPLFCLAGAAAATTSLIGSLVLALGRVDLITKFELAYQPFRAALIVAAALIFQSIMACAAALVIAFFLLVPMMYSVKSRCIPNDHRVLRRYLLRSLGVTALALALPTLLAAVGAAGSQGPRWLAFGLAIPLCIVGWLTALVALKHPLAQDSAFLAAREKCLALLRHPLRGP